MQINFRLFLLLIPVLRTQAYWQLKWRDEFDSDSLDLNKWDVTNEELSCDGNYIQQIHCKTNNSRNLWLVDSALAIAAFPERQKYLDKDYTSAMITTKEGFTFGKFEVRAALPKGKMLRPAMYFLPTKNTGHWPKDGQIDLMTNIQAQSTGNGIHIVRQYNQYIGKEYKTGADLAQFHSYTLEWNESMIIWKFDDIQHQTINLTKELDNYYNPFNFPFKLVITLGVGGQFFSGMLTKEDIQDWHCSLLILDYVKVFEWIDGNKPINTSDLIVTNKIASDPNTTCQVVMPLIRLPIKLSFPFTVVVSSLSLILLLALIPLVIYMFIRQKRLRLNDNRNRNSGDFYYEDIEPQVYYEDTKENEYADPSYQMQSTNHYTNDCINHFPERETEYIQMTNKYVNK